MYGQATGKRPGKWVRGQAKGARPGNGCAGLEGEEETIIFEKKREIGDVVIFCAGLASGKTAQSSKGRAGRPWGRDPALGARISKGVSDQAERCAGL